MARMARPANKSTSRRTVMTRAVVSPGNVAPASGTLTARVTDALRQSIIDGDYQLGDALSEIRLAANFGVSRTPVREALTSLQRQGLIVIRPQSGSYVFLPSEEDVAELCEFRRLVEVAALRFAHARRRGRTLAQMRETLAAMDAASATDDRRAYAYADSMFHQSIVENSANAYLIEAYKLVSGRVGALRSHNLIGADELRGKSTAAHRAIADAFERGDLLKAEEVIDEHVLLMNVGFRAAMRRARQVAPARPGARA